MFVLAVLSLLQLAAAAVIKNPASTEVPAWSSVELSYVVDNALSSGSKDIYVYREPGHVLIDEYHRPFAGNIVRSFTFTAPDAGPFEVVVYDVITYGVAQTPATVLAKVGFTATSRQ